MMCDIVNVMGNFISSVNVPLCTLQLNYLEPCISGSALRKIASFRATGAVSIPALPM